MEDAQPVFMFTRSTLDDTPSSSPEGRDMPTTLPLDLVRCVCLLPESWLYGWPPDLEHTATIAVLRQYGTDGNVLPLTPVYLGTRSVLTSSVVVGEVGGDNRRPMCSFDLDFALEYSCIPKGKCGVTVRPHCGYLIRLQFEPSGITWSSVSPFTLLPDLPPTPVPHTTPPTKSYVVRKVCGCLCEPCTLYKNTGESGGSENNTARHNNVTSPPEPWTYRAFREACDHLFDDHCLEDPRNKVKATRIVGEVFQRAALVQVMSCGSCQAGRAVYTPGQCVHIAFGEMSAGMM
eukprot:PhF_6_TR35065/c0_g1_i1/m.51101